MAASDCTYFICICIHSFWIQLPHFKTLFWHDTPHDNKLRFWINLIIFHFTIYKLYYMQKALSPSFKIHYCSYLNELVPHDFQLSFLQGVSTQQAAWVDVVEMWLHVVQNNPVTKNKHKHAKSLVYMWFTRQIRPLFIHHLIFMRQVGQSELPTSKYKPCIDILSKHWGAIVCAYNCLAHNFIH